MAAVYLIDANGAQYAWGLFETFEAELALERALHNPELDFVDGWIEPRD